MTCPRCHSPLRLIVPARDFAHYQCWPNAHSVRIEANGHTPPPPTAYQRAIADKPKCGWEGCRKLSMRNQRGCPLHKHRWGARVAV